MYDHIGKKLPLVKSTKFEIPHTQKIITSTYRFGNYFYSMGEWTEINHNKLVENTFYCCFRKSVTFHGGLVSAQCSCILR